MLKACIVVFLLGVVSAAGYSALLSGNLWNEAAVTGKSPNFNTAEPTLQLRR